MYCCIAYHPDCMHTVRCTAMHPLSYLNSYIHDQLLVSKHPPCALYFASPVSTHIPCALRHILRDCRVISEPRKSRLVSLAEGLMKPIDEHVRERVNAIFAEKERYAYQLKQKAQERTH